MIKVIMCGNHPSNKGGMTSVISQILEHEWRNEDIHLTFIPTYMPGSKLRTILYFAQALLHVFFEFLFCKPDVFYTHMSSKGSFTRTKALHELCKLFGVKDVIHLHGSEFKKWYQSVENKKQEEIRNLIRESDAFVVLGNKWEKFVGNIAPDANIVSLSNCVKIPDCVADWSNDKLQFLYLGVLIPRKGVADLLKAVKLLAEKGKIEKIQLNIAGVGPEEGELKKFVTDNQLEKYTNFMGWISGSEKEEALREANVFILPSYNEGLPVSILEAMSYGLPIISTNVGDISSAVYQDDNGFLVEPGDVEALSIKMSELLDYATWRKFSTRSREIIEEKFDINYFYKGLVSVWKSTIENEIY